MEDSQNIQNWILIPLLKFLKYSPPSISEFCCLRLRGDRIYLSFWRYMILENKVFFESCLGSSYHIYDHFDTKPNLQTANLSECAPARSGLKFKTCWFWGVFFLDFWMEHALFSRELGVYALLLVLFRERRQADICCAVWIPILLFEHSRGSFGLIIGALCFGLKFEVKREISRWMMLRWTQVQGIMLEHKVLK